MLTSSKIQNCTIQGKGASSTGGGIATLSGQTSLDSCTITLKSAAIGTGSGISSVGTSAEATQLINTIAAGNYNTDLNYTGSTNTFQSSGYNVDRGDNEAAHFIANGDQALAMLPRSGFPGGQ